MASVTASVTASAQPHSPSDQTSPQSTSSPHTHRTQHYPCQPHTDRLGTTRTSNYDQAQPDAACRSDNDPRNMPRTPPPTSLSPPRPDQTCWQDTPSSSQCPYSQCSVQYRMMHTPWHSQCRCSDLTRTTRTRYCCRAARQANTWASVPASEQLLDSQSVQQLVHTGRLTRQVRSPRLRPTHIARNTTRHQTARLPGPLYMSSGSSTNHTATKLQLTPPHHPHQLPPFQTIASAAASGRLRVVPSTTSNSRAQRRAT